MLYGIVFLLIVDLDVGNIFARERDLVVGHIVVLKRWIHGEDDVTQCTCGVQCWRE